MNAECLEKCPDIYKCSLLLDEQVADASTADPNVNDTAYQEHTRAITRAGCALLGVLAGAEQCAGPVATAPDRSQGTMTTQANQNQHTKSAPGRSAPYVCGRHKFRRATT